MNKNWPRWIRASINKHFTDRKSNVVLYIEGMERQTSGLQDFAELRIDGPYLREKSKDYWEITVEINVLIQAIPDNGDLYKIDRTIGTIFAAFEKTISVFKFGTDPVDDDQTLLGCLQIIVDESDGDGVIVSKFGIIEPDVNMEQATVEAHYRMRLVL